MTEYIAISDRQNNWEVLSALGDHSKRLYERIICSAPDVAENDLDKWYSGAMAGLIRRWAGREHLQLGYSIAEAVKQNDMVSAYELIKKDQELILLMQETDKERQYCWQRES